MNQTHTDYKLLISMAKLMHEKVPECDFTEYLQSNLNTVIYELERQHTLQQSKELRFIQKNNGGHIRKDLDSLGDGLGDGVISFTDNSGFNVGLGQDSYEHSSYYWETDRNK